MKKKVISLLLCVMTALSVSLPVYAVREPSTGKVYSDIMSSEKNVTFGPLTIELDSSEALVVGCKTSAKGTITIPAKVNGRSVVMIDSESFKNCKNITRVNIPDSVSIIGHQVFEGCTALEAVNIPKNVSYIGMDTFIGTKVLEQSYKNGAAYIGNWLIDTKENHGRHLKIADGTVGIATLAAMSRVGITTVTIPKSVKYICYGAFAGEENLQKVIFEGDPPLVDGLLSELYYDVFLQDTFTAYYPSENYKWENDYLFQAVCSGDITWIPARFVDLLYGSWYDSKCEQAVNYGLMNGVGNNRFDPNGTTSRAMFAQILYNMAGRPEISDVENPFTDVSVDQWYANAVLWAYREGVTSGTSATTFSPNENVTREQIATLLYNYCRKPEVTGDFSAFVDGDRVDEWAVNAMLWATQNKIINGSLNEGVLYLNPRDNAIRAETATMMVNFCEPN